MSVTSARSKRSVTAEARRAQIIEATVRVIARDGFGLASFAAITAEAGLSSTRMISYHFADKAELVGAVFTAIVESMGSEVGARVRAADTAAGRLRAYIKGVVGFTAAHQDAMRTLLQIVLAGALPQTPEASGGASAHVEAILRDGQQNGEFRDFDPAVVAAAVQRSLEGLPFLIASDPDLDCTAYARELVTLFELGTRRS